MDSIIPVVLGLMVTTVIMAIALIYTIEEVKKLRRNIDGIIREYEDYVEAMRRLSSMEM